MTLAETFCSCIKQVRKNFPTESRAIAICVKSVLHSRGKTLKKFKCRPKPMLKTQTRRRSGRSRRGKN